MNCNISRNTICFSTLLQQIYILIEIKTPRGLSIHMASFKHATSDGILNGFISSYKKCVWFFFQQSIIYLNILPATISQLVMSYFCRLSSVWQRHLSEKTLKNWKVSLASFKMCMCAPVQQCTGAKIILNSTYIHTCSMDSSSNYFICDDKKNFTLASLIVPQSVSSWKRTH